MQQLEYFLFIILRQIVLALPLKSAQRLGYYLGSAAYYVVGRRRKVALDNLAHAFPEKSAQEREKIAKGSFRNFAISFIELLWFPNLNDEMMRKLIRLQNPDLFLEAYKKGKGMVELTGHFGNWELAAIAVPYLSRITATIIVQTQSNRKVDEVINSHRTLFGNRVAPMGAGIRETMRAIQDRGVIALAADQSGPMEGVFVEFFGRLVATHQGPAVFALRSGAPLQMALAVRQADGTYEVIFHDIETSDLSGRKEEDILELTRRHTALLEEYIRQYPDQWHWSHRRWKHTWESVQKEKNTSLAGSEISRA